jgi:predicted enzyme related to lactoylglutathione lyase
MKKVTGIGGIFFKCKDTAAMKDWYAKNLGFPVTNFGTMFNWRDEENPEKTGTTVWSPFAENTKYFAPSEKDYMINYIVENIEELVAQLKADGVTVLDDIADSEYGKFVHILDPEGNKIELWQAPAE